MQLGRREVLGTSGSNKNCVSSSMELGNYYTKRWSNTNAKGKRGLVVQRVNKTGEEDRRLQTIELAPQGLWMQWDQALERPLMDAVVPGT